MPVELLGASYATDGSSDISSVQVKGPAIDVNLSTTEVSTNKVFLVRQEDSMATWTVTFEPTNLLGGDQFAPQDKDCVAGRAALLDNVNTSSIPRVRPPCI